MNWRKAVQIFSDVTIEQIKRRNNSRVRYEFYLQIRPGKHPEIHLACVTVGNTDYTREHAEEHGLDDVANTTCTFGWAG